MPLEDNIQKFIDNNSYIDQILLVTFLRLSVAVDLIKISSNLEYGEINRNTIRYLPAPPNISSSYLKLAKFHTDNFNDEANYYTISNVLIIKKRVVTGINNIVCSISAYEPSVEKDEIFDREIYNIKLPKAIDFLNYLYVVLAEYGIILHNFYMKNSNTVNVTENIGFRHIYAILNDISTMTIIYGMTEYLLEKIRLLTTRIRYLIHYTTSADTIIAEIDLINISTTSDSDISSLETYLIATLNDTNNIIHQYLKFGQKITTLTDSRIFTSLSNEISNNCSFNNHSDFLVLNTKLIPKITEVLFELTKRMESNTIEKTRTYASDKFVTEYVSTRTGPELNTLRRYLDKILIDLEQIIKNWEIFNSNTLKITDDSNFTILSSNLLNVSNLFNSKVAKNYYQQKLYYVSGSSTNPLTGVGSTGVLMNVVNAFNSKIAANYYQHQLYTILTSLPYFLIESTSIPDLKLTDFWKRSSKIWCSDCSYVKDISDISNIILTFSEKVSLDKINMNVVIYDVRGNVFEVIVTDQIKGVAEVITISPIGYFIPETVYYIKISSTTFYSTHLKNYFTGVTNTESLRFTAMHRKLFNYVSVVPAHHSTDQSITQDLDIKLTFRRLVTKNTGNLTIYEYMTDALVIQLIETSTGVSVNADKTVSIHISKSLLIPSTKYYMLIDKLYFITETDLFRGVLTKYDYTFTTEMTYDGFIFEGDGSLANIDAIYIFSFSEDIYTLISGKNITLKKDGVEIIQIDSDECTITDNLLKIDLGILEPMMSDYTIDIERGAFIGTMGNSSPSILGIEVSTNSAVGINNKLIKLRSDINNTITSYATLGANNVTFDLYSGQNLSALRKSSGKICANLKHNSILSSINIGSLDYIYVNKGDSVTIYKTLLNSNIDKITINDGGTLSLIDSSNNFRDLNLSYLTNNGELFIEVGVSGGYITADKLNRLGPSKFILKGVLTVTDYTDQDVSQVNYNGGSMNIETLVSGINVSLKYANLIGIGDINLKGPVIIETSYLKSKHTYITYDYLSVEKKITITGLTGIDDISNISLLNNSHVVIEVDGVVNLDNVDYFPTSNPEFTQKIVIKGGQLSTIPLVIITKLDDIEVNSYILIVNEYYKEYISSKITSYNGTVILNCIIAAYNLKEINYLLDTEKFTRRIVILGETITIIPDIGLSRAVEIMDKITGSVVIYGKIVEVLSNFVKNKVTTIDFKKVLDRFNIIEIAVVDDELDGDEFVILVNLTKNNILYKPPGIGNIKSTLSNANYLFTKTYVRGIRRENFTISDRTILASELNILNESTSGVIDVHNLSEIRGTLLDIKNIYTISSSKIIGLGNENIVITDTIVIVSSQEIIELNTIMNYTTTNITATISGDSEILKLLQPNNTKCEQRLTITVNSVINLTNGKKIADSTSNTSVDFSNKGLKDTLDMLGYDNYTYLDIIVGKDEDIFIEITDEEYSSTSPIIIQALILKTIGSKTTGMCVVSNAVRIEGSASDMVGALVSSGSKVIANISEIGITSGIITGANMSSIIEDTGNLVNLTDTICDVTGDELLIIRSIKTVTLDTTSILNMSTELSNGFLGTGTLKLNGGTLSINDNSIFKGTLLHTSSSVIDVVTNKIFTYTGMGMDLGPFTLTIDGGGTLINRYSIYLNNPISVINITDTSRISILTTGADMEKGKGLQIDDSCTITTLILNHKCPINIKEKVTVNIPTIELNISGIALFENTGRGGRINAPGSGTLILNGGTLDINKSQTIGSFITHTADSVINITYNSDILTLDDTRAIDLCDFTLTVSGSGSIHNSQAINLNNADSSINIIGESTIKLLTVGVTSNKDKGVNIRADCTITQFRHKNSFEISLGGNLVITSPINLGSNTMTLSGTGNLGGGIIVLDSSDSLIHITGVCTVLNSITFSENSNPNKGIYADADVILSGTVLMAANTTIGFGDNTLNMTGPSILVREFTLSLLGSGKFLNTNTIILDDENSLIKLSKKYKFKIYQQSNISSFVNIKKFIKIIISNVNYLITMKMLQV